MREKTLKLEIRVPEEHRDIIQKWLVDFAEALVEAISEPEEEEPPFLEELLIESGAAIILEEQPVIIAIKKWNRKGDRLYGPYPKAEGEYYLYEQHKDRETGEYKLEYLGRGKAPPGAIVKEVVGVTDLLKTGILGAR